MARTSDIMSLLEAGVRAEGLRQNAIASNVANLETAGYRRIDVRFEQLLDKALNSSKNIDPKEIEPQLHQPENTPVKSNGNDVNWEAEVGEMVKNTLRQRTYIRLIQKKLSQIDLAINIRTTS